jgi:hypothetical protein
VDEDIIQESLTYKQRGRYRQKQEEIREDIFFVGIKAEPDTPFRCFFV